MSLSATARFTPRGDLGRFVSARVTPAVTASVEAAGALIEQSAKLYCPVDTGELQGSITTEIIPTDSSVRSATAPHTSYAAYVEFGTGQRGAVFKQFYVMFKLFNTFVQRVITDKCFKIFIWPPIHKSYHGFHSTAYFLGVIISELIFLVGTDFPISSP